MIDGITIRDYFAAKAMEALVTSFQSQLSAYLSDHDRAVLRQEAVKTIGPASYQIADLMLKARKVEVDPC